jgi:hypothetical protein
MKKISILLALVLLLSIFANAQTRAKAIFLEGGGPGVGSINFDMRFTHSNAGWGARVGVGYVSATDNTSKVTIFAIPLGVNYLLALNENQSHFLEGGLGGSFIRLTGLSPNNSFFLNGSFGFAEIGYRYAPATKGILFRINWTPLFSDRSFNAAYGGLSLGWKF